MARKLIIPDTPKGEYKPCPQGKTPLMTALVSATCVISCLIIILSVITLKTWIYPQSGDQTITVSILPDARETFEANVSEQKSRPAIEKNASTLETPELIVTSSPRAEWNWVNEKVPDQMVEADPELNDILRDCREFDLGTEWKKQIKKVAGSKRGANRVQAASASSGGEGGPVNHLARYKYTPLPPYPRSARLDRLEGVVILLIHVNEEGLPKHVSVSESSGVPLLDEVSVSWVSKNWTFHPATGNKGYVACQIKAPIRFQLN